MEAKRKNSKKRQAIYDALCNTVEHPSAETLYAQLKTDIPDLSLGTVYRNLAMFIEDGDAVIVGNVDGEARYDARTDSHPHFICRRCGQVIDIMLDADIEALYDKVYSVTGCKADNHALTFYGLCDKCK